MLPSSRTLSTDAGSNNQFFETFSFILQASDSEEVVTPLMLDGTYLSRNFATLGPLTLETPCVNHELEALTDECWKFLETGG